MLGSDGWDHPAQTCNGDAVSLANLQPGAAARRHVTSIFSCDALSFGDFSFWTIGLTLHLLGILLDPLHLHDASNESFSPGAAGPFGRDRNCARSMSPRRSGKIASGNPEPAVQT